jgi:hypothetical protein
MGLAELEPIQTQPLPASAKEIAFRWIADLVYHELLQSGQSASGRDLLPLVNESASVGPKALKIALEQDPRIRREDRRWVATVQGIDAKRPIERAIVAIIEAAGYPLSLQAIGRQLAFHYPREESALMELAERLVRGRQDFFMISNDLIGLTSWLLDPAAGNKEDVEFENFEDTTEIEGIQPLARQVDWQSGTLQEGAVRLLDLTDQAISNKALQFFLWQQRPERFDPAQYFRLLFERKDVRLVSPSAWIGPQSVSKFNAVLNEVELSATDVELTNDDVPKPITVEAEDIDTIAESLTAAPARTAELLTVQFSDLRADDPNYNTTLSSLDKAIRADSRFMWVGWDRFSAPQPVPDSVKEFPEVLVPVVVDIEISAGQQEDVELDDEGLEGSLAQDIEQSIVKYGGFIERDEDAIKCVVTYGPRQAGALPVGDDSALVPKQPEFLLITTVDEAGETKQHWLNNDLRLLYDLGDWYKSVDLPVSGGLFTLEPQGGPGHYEIAYHGGSDPETYLDPNRVKDLLAIREHALAHETSTREIIQRIMSHHSKGMSFPQLYAEVCVARMTSARMIASILSSYYEFYTKGKLWLFNERDAGKGFKKQKKKYLRKR